MSRPTENELANAKNVINAERRAKAQEDQRKIDKHFEGYMFWCSEGCGFVDRNHRCEQWCSLTNIPPKAVEAIRNT